MGSAAASKSTNSGPEQNEYTQDEQPMQLAEHSLHKGRLDAASSRDPLMAFKRLVSLRAKREIERYNNSV